MKKDNFEGAASQKYVVNGSYLYYHYMQDNFNDNVRVIWFEGLYRDGAVLTGVCKV